MFRYCLSSTVSVSVPHPSGRSLIPVRNLIFCSLYTAILFFASLSSCFAIRCYMQFVFWFLTACCCAPSMLHWYFYPTLRIYLDKPWIYVYIFRCGINVYPALHIYFMKLVGQGWVRFSPYSVQSYDVKGLFSYLLKNYEFRSSVSVVSPYLTIYKFVMSHPCIRIRVHVV